MELLARDVYYLNEYSIPPHIQFKNNANEHDHFYVNPSRIDSDFETGSDFYPQSEDGKRVSEEEYWEIYYEDPEFKYEWVNGVLKEKGMPVVGTYKLKSWMEILISEFLKKYPIALFAVEDIGFKMTLKEMSSIRRPDFALILNKNSDHPQSTDRRYSGIYDLCVEYLSDSSKKYVENDTVHKKQEYEEAGVKEYYIIDINKKHTVFYALNDVGQTKGKSNNKSKSKVNVPTTYRKIEPINGVIHSNVLPGFKFRVNDIYEQPDFKDLIHDDVYKSYVLLDYQEQCKKAESEIKARERIEKEIKQLEQEKMKIEQEKMKMEQEKMQALQKAESEKMNREQAENEIKRLLQIMNEKGIPPEIET